MGIVTYKHHGREVSVREDLKGKHTEHCLCYECRFFDLDDRESNCPTANALYRFDVLTGCTTPMWECPDFEVAAVEPCEGDASGDCSGCSAFESCESYKKV